MPFAITTYEWFLAAHILTAVLWVGGAFAIQVFALRAARTSGERLAAVAGDAEWIGTRIFIPSSLLLVIFGFLLIGEGNWDYEFWIVFAIVVWAASFIVGATFLGPESGRVSKAIERHGADSPEVTDRLRRLFLVSRIELTFLILVVLDMALKPGS